MILKHYSDIPPMPATEGPGIMIRWLISKSDGAENFAMRLFELEPGASSPFHHHPEEHEVYILEGQGEIRTAQGLVPLKSGDFIFILPEETHQLTNTANTTLRFICLIPLYAA